jgi:hypothetical protein
MRRSIATMSILGVLLLSLVTALPGTAAQEANLDTATHPLVGAWLLDALPDVDGNPPAITTFHADGSISEIGGQGEVGAGTWLPTSPQGADATIVSQIRDADGGFIGLQTVRASLDVSADDALTGTWTLEPPSAMAIPAGMPVGELGPGQVVARRIDVQAPGETVGPIPEGPPADAAAMELYMRGTDQVADLTMPPRAGQTNIVGSDLYQLGGSADSPLPTGEPIGRRVAVCTVATAGEAVCEGMLRIDGRGTISAQLEVLIPGGNQGIAITGGTDEFAGRTGTITERPVAGHPNDRVLEVSFG